MNALSLSQLAEMAAGRLVNGDASAKAQGVSTDSRKAGPGDLFIALRGEKFDAHQFIAEVAKRGVAAVMVDTVPSPLPSCGVIFVPDTLTGLQTLARNYRKALECTVVGITGSNGKTSTKDICATVLESHLRVTKTFGNLNNHIGLPLSVLGISSAHQAAILEMGMNHPGEIAPLAAIARPDLAIITNIGVAHIEYMGSRAAIAQEKSMLAEAVGPDGTVVLNAGDDFTPSIAARCQARVVTAGIDAGEVRVTSLVASAAGSRFVIKAMGESAATFLPIPGRHMAGNAALAVAAGMACGIPLAECAVALEYARLTGGRLEAREIGGIHFLDDSYNANPDSMTAALGTLLDIPGDGQKIAILGAMGELGEHSEAGHSEAGRAALGVDALIVVGEIAKWIGEGASNAGVLRIICVRDTEQAAEELLQLVHYGDCVLVKGSRSARMERVITTVEAMLGGATLQSVH